MAHIVLTIDGQTILDSQIALTGGGTQPVTPVQPPVNPPVTPPVVPAGGRPIPFARYLAEGRDLDWVQTFGGWGALSPAEFEAAYAAGYPRPVAPPPPSGGGDLSGFDFDTGPGFRRNVNPANQESVYHATCHQAGTFYFELSVSVQVSGAHPTNVKCWATKNAGEIVAPARNINLQYDHMGPFPGVPGDQFYLHMVPDDTFVVVVAFRGMQPGQGA